MPTRGRLRWINCSLAAASIWIGVALAPARAQVLADSASETERNAAYCMGFYEQTLASDQSLGLPADHAARATLSASAQRMRSYLITQGIGLSGARARHVVLAVAVARQRGAADQQKCWAQIGLCTDRCRGNKACSSPCVRQEAACGAGRRCDKVERQLLP